MSHHADPEVGTDHEVAAPPDIDADLAIAIWEDGKQVGIVNIDEETYEYNGGYDRIEQVLETMATDGFAHRVPVEEPPEDRHSVAHPPTERVKRTGIELAQYLPRLIEQKGRGNINVNVEPVGYDREYGDSPSPEETLGIAANDSNQ